MNVEDSVEIRLAEEADADAISLLLIESAHEFFPEFSSQGLELYIKEFSPEPVRKRIASPGYRHYVATTGSELAGVCTIRGENHLLSLFTAKALHRRGVARKLWARALDDLMNNGVTEVTVNASNYAVPVYEKFGFVRVSETRDVDGIVINPMVYRVTGRGDR